MKITYYGYNSFLVEEGDIKVAIDPGASLYLFKLGPVIPRESWPSITHVVVTHGDPDHYWHVDRVAQVSGAPIICGSELVRFKGDQPFIASPRSRIYKHETPVDRVFPMDCGDKKEVDQVNFEAYPSVHGELEIPLLGGLVKKTVVRKPDSLFTKGEMAFLMEIGGYRIANLGDSLKLDSWDNMKPDILMIPIGGKIAKNTMDEESAAEVVSQLKPKWVIPCHYDCGALFNRRLNRADVKLFSRLVKEAGSKCVILTPGMSWSPGSVE